VKDLEARLAALEAENEALKQKVDASNTQTCSSEPMNDNDHGFLSEDDEDVIEFI
jgi:cell division protein FtsB